MLSDTRKSAITIQVRYEHNTNMGTVSQPHLAREWSSQAPWVYAVSSIAVTLCSLVKNVSESRAVKQKFLISAKATGERKTRAFGFIISKTLPV